MACFQGKKTILDLGMVVRSLFSGGAGPARGSVNFLEPVPFDDEETIELLKLSLPHGGVRPFHRKSTCPTKSTLGPDVVQRWSRYCGFPVERNPRDPPEFLPAGERRGDNLNYCEAFRAENGSRQGQNLDLTVLDVACQYTQHYRAAGFPAVWVLRSGVWGLGCEVCAEGCGVSGLQSMLEGV